MKMTCTHPLRIDTLCCDCGLDIKDDTKLYQVLHNNKDIKLTEEEALARDRQYLDTLHQNKKLVLVLDLDQTILHTTVSREYMYSGKCGGGGGNFGGGDEYGTGNCHGEGNGSFGGEGNDNFGGGSIENEDLYRNMGDLNRNMENNDVSKDDIEKDVFKDGIYNIYETPLKKHKLPQDNQQDNPQYNTYNNTYNNSPHLEGYHNILINNTIHVVKFRPYLTYMLESLTPLYEIHVYTMGTREYATKIVNCIDPFNKYINNRIISRDENGLEFKKNLNKLFSIHSNVVILDDRDDVWDYCSNVVVVRPYYYWDVGDINEFK